MLLETKRLLVSAKDSRTLEERITKFIANNKWILYIQFNPVSYGACVISFGIFYDKPELERKVCLGNKSKILQFKPVTPVKDINVRWFKYVSSPYPETTTIIKHENTYFIYEAERRIEQDIVDSKFINPKIDTYE